MSDSSEKTKGSKFSNVNLRVTEDERWEFKSWCSAHRMSQVDAFREAFDLLKKSRDGHES